MCQMTDYHLECSETAVILMDPIDRWRRYFCIEIVSKMFFFFSDFPVNRIKSWEEPAQAQ